MQTRLGPFIGVCWFVIGFLATPFLAIAQTPSDAASRITQAVDETRLTVLRGNTHPLARNEFDRGLAPGSLPMQRMLLVLKRSPQQEAALDALLAQQQDKSSANYHRWFTPQQFGSQFGPTDQDIQAIASWLQSQGFQVNRVSNGRTVIEFSGVASQVQQAFHTAIHRYAVNGEDHWANSTDPQIPDALAPVVAGVATLHNFPRQAMHHIVGAFSRSKDTGAMTPLQPLFTLGGQCGVPGIGCHGVTPYDFATIYNVAPLWNAMPTHIDGTGQTIAIVGESDIATQDITDFRTYFGLPPANLQIIHDGPDPGVVPGDEIESTLDVEWAGAVAKNANIDFVVSQSTGASLGVDLSAEYIVDNNLAPILSESYGECEQFLGTAGNQFYNQLWQQAAAQGITVLVGSGDSGSAVCDQSQSPPPAPAAHGLTVSGFSSTPYNVAVGGTDFNDLTNPSTYWSATNSAPPGSPSGTPATVSVLSYIPEATWNSSCTNTEALSLLGFNQNAETDCNNSQLLNLVIAVGGSGGKSSCTTYEVTSGCVGGYSKPSWQAALTPRDASRDVPDVSLFAAASSPSGSFYVICEADQVSAGSSCRSTDPDTNFLAIGGTSASTPAFAGIMALVNQKTGTSQGNANYVLYKLAAQQPTAFHDVATGTIAMPCAAGSTRDCNTSQSGDAYGVLSGYSAEAGYDLATGLGSVNANTLVNAWATADTAAEPSTTTLTLNSGNAVNITHGQSVGFSINVAAAPPGAGTPTGNVSLIANVAPPGAPSEVSQQNVQGFTLTNGGVSSSTNLLPGGSYTMFAQYPGDGTFSESESTPAITVTVAPEASQIGIAFELFSPVTGVQIAQHATGAPFGFPSLLHINVTSESGDTCAQNARGQSGCPTGSIALTDNGNSLNSGVYALNSLGYAEDKVIQLAVGTHALKATYGGDNSFTGSTGTDVITITQAPTTITLQGPSSIPDLPYALGGVVSTQSTATQTPPTGMVQFFVGGAPAGNPVLVSGGSKSGFAQATVNYQVPLPVGQDSVTAQYNGDSNYLPSSMSAPIMIHVLATTTTTLTVSPGTTIQQGQSVTFTAQVTANQSGGPAPTGTVRFSLSGASLASPVALANGTAQLTTSSLPPGTDFVVASYSGDANNESSPSTTVMMTVSPAFTISTNPSLISISAPGQTGSTVLTLTSQNGFSSSTNLGSAACTGLPAESSCSFNPSTITLAANGTATTTLTVSTTAPSAMLPGTRSHRDDFGGWIARTTIAFGCVLCLGMLLFGASARRRRRRWISAFAAVLFALLLASAGCGGGGSSTSGSESNGGTGGVTNPGTPTGYWPVSVTVTINGATETQSMQVEIQ